MGNVSKALKKIFKIWKFQSQLLKRLQAIEEALNDLQETRFAIGGELAADRACAVEALAEEIVELEAYSTPGEAQEARERVADLERHLVADEVPDIAYRLDVAGDGSDELTLEGRAALDEFRQRLLDDERRNRVAGDQANGAGQGDAPDPSPLDSVD
ncbi:hypothetical protein LCGC14_1835390 [marine sediment metagenome]|uniref:Uncharacterized protein n=1 Tax=marine sediment metagenome TaxID=412755 RepID=A0A0F9H304_9ZZZZ